MLREPDADLIDYLLHNVDPLLQREDIVGVLALVPGHNDEDEWHWIIRLHGRGRYAWTHAGCDYTGWDCQSWGETVLAKTAREACLLAPVKEEGTGRAIQENLMRQLRGVQPFGIEVVLPKKGEYNA